MALSTGHVASQLRHIIYYHLDNNLIRNALFLAERLHAYEPRSFEAQYLLSLCHLHNGEIKAALEFSQPSGSRGLHAGCSYVYAQACLDLGKYLDGATALERSKALWATKNHWSRLPPGDMPFVHISLVPFSRRYRMVLILNFRQAQRNTKATSSRCGSRLLSTGKAVASAQGLE